MEKKQIISGKNYEEALSNAELQLGLDRDNFSHLIIQREKSGFLGIGAQPCKIEVTFEVPDPIPEAPKVALSSASRSKPKAEKPAAPVKPAAPKAEAPKVEKKAEEKKVEAPMAEKKVEAPKPEKPRAPKAEKKVDAPNEPKVFTPAEPGSVEEKIEQFIKGLLERMGSDAVPHAWKESGDNYKVELTGADLGYLIGRWGDTLDAIQHLANHAINRCSDGHIRISVDAEEYRAKREDSLRRYARKKASQVLKARRRCTLEPMNAYERHVIHAALQEMDNITTHSTGTEPNRRVVIEYVK